MPPAALLRLPRAATVSRRASRQVG